MIKKLILIIISFFLFISIWVNAKWDIKTTEFEINIDDFSPWWTSSLIQDNTTDTINYTLGTIIQKLMIWLGSVALVIMTAWAWYIIIYHGQDELLSKWKSMFISWIIALAVALSSYYLVDIVKNLLY